MGESVDEISLVDFVEVWETSVEIGDCRHLWDWLAYRGHIITEKEA